MKPPATSWRERGNIEYEAKAILGIIKNQAGIKLVNSPLSKIAEKMGVKYFKGSRNIKNYSTDLKQWHKTAKAKKSIYGNRLINTATPPTILLNIVKK